MLIINSIQLPKDILEIIKNYIFYNDMTSPMIKNIKNTKIQLCILINKSITSRASYSNNSLSEYWSFISFCNSQLIHIGSINCKICGEYKTDVNVNSLLDYYISNNIIHIITPRIICKCVFI